MIRSTYTFHNKIVHQFDSSSCIHLEKEEDKQNQQSPLSYMYSKDIEGGLTMSSPKGQQGPYGHMTRAIEVWSIQ